MRRSILPLAVVLYVMLGSVGEAPAASCPNESLRAGASSQLAECRAYELVTPPDTNGAGPLLTVNATEGFETPSVTPNPVAPTAPESALFGLFGGSVPGIEGNGNSDTYLATRGSDGWTSALVSPTGAEAERVEPGGTSADHLFSTYRTIAGSRGSLAGPEAANYVREPSGAFSLLGRSDSGESDPGAKIRWVSPGDGHRIFTSEKRLTPDGGAAVGPFPTESADSGYANFPAAGVYDRTPEGLRAVSLLPGDVTPGTSLNTYYRGSTSDGDDVLFNYGRTMYLRRDDESTIPVAGSESAAPGTQVSCVAAEGPEVVSYQWLRNGAPIAGATSRTYTLAAADEGTYVECQTTETSLEGGSVAVSEAAIAVRREPGQYTLVPPNVIPRPTSSEEEIAVGGKGGQTLTCHAEPQPGERESPPGFENEVFRWGGSPSFSYRWYRNGTPIPGAKASTYKTTKADVAAPAYFQCEVTGTDAEGAIARSSEVLYTTPAPNVNPASARVPGFVPVARGIEIAGITPDGGKITYVRRELNGFHFEGDIFVYEPASGRTTQVTTGENSQVVNVSADGSHIYLISPEQLDGSAGTQGANNFYVWDGRSFTFIGEVSAGDLENQGYDLNFWISAIGAAASAEGNAHGPTEATSRTTPDGDVIVFESQARLTAYDNENEFGEQLTEIYRYDTLAPAGQKLVCVSCNPAGLPPRSAAKLTLTIEDNGRPGVPITYPVTVENLTTDGEAVYFETSEALVPTDVDGVQDVYQWKDGQVSLISSGKSTAANWIFGVSPDGHDVYFTSSDRLVAAKTDSTVALYDARVDGGFPASGAGTAGCEGDSCQGEPAAALGPPRPGSSLTTGGGNLRPGCRAAAARARKSQSTLRRVRRRVAHLRRPARGRTTLERAQRRATKAVRATRICRKNQGRRGK